MKNGTAVVDKVRWFEEMMISSEIRADVGSLMRARVTLVAGLLAFLLIFSLRLLEMVQTPEMISAVLPRALQSCLMLLPAILLKRMKSVEVPTALFSFGVVIAFSVAMWSEGGLHSVNLLFIAVVPALLGFIASTRVFAVCMVCMLCTLSIVGYATWTGMSFAVPISQSILLVWSSTVAALLTGATLAWFIHGQLRSSLQAQEEELGQRRRMEDLLRESTRRAEAANRSKDAFLAYTSHVHDQLQSSLQIQEQELSQRRRMEGLLRASTRSAEAANRSKDAFLAYISHEIRNPLTSILGAVELFSTSSDEVSRSRYLPAIEASGNNLLRLVNRLLDLGKLQAGRVDLEVNRVHVRQLIEEMASATRGYVGSRPVEVQGQVEPSVPAHVGIDETRIRQVLSNLLSNAAKNTPQGRIDVTVTDLSGAALKIAIADTGVGIPGDALQQVFEEYIQVREEFDEVFSGTGLGLSIVRESLKLMDGEVHIESELGEGTQVYVTVPYTAAPTAASVATSMDKVRLRSGRILLAEDEEANRAIVTAILESLDQEVIQVEDGGQAIEESALRRVDLVLMDMRMPRVDGLTAARRIRERERIQGDPPVPIVALTANPEKLADAICMEAGVDGVLGKPVTRKRLAEVLERWLGSSEEQKTEGKAASR